jgi:hypothetical protein
MRKWSIKVRGKKNPRPFTTGDLTILQTIKIVSLIINRVLLRKKIKPGYNYLKVFFN